MKKNVIYIYTLVLCGITAFFSGCTDEMESQPIVQEEIGAKVLTLVASLSEEGTDSRLAHVGMGGKAFVTYWEKDDYLAANALPGDEASVFIYKLKDGAGTRVGTFECDSLPSIYKPENYHTNAWTIYFPGSKIMGEEDYLNFSYWGQKQIGNNNYDHIEDYHTIRLTLGDGQSHFGFGTDSVNFNSERLEQSACMRFNLSGFETPIIPTKVELMYINPQGAFEACFHTHNYLDSWWGGKFSANPETSSFVGLDLEGFESTQNITAYLMMSNYPVTVKAGGKFRVYVTDMDGNRYYCDKDIAEDSILEGGLMHRITCTSWKVGNIDAFDNPTKGVFVLQEASIGNGTDIVIMGDGFAEDQFGDGGNYASIMEQAYHDFFSVEPYASLQDYFNVYYINAVSQDNHDAVPYWSGGSVGSGAQNGAVNGTSLTRFSTQFTPNSTSITGNNAAVLQYVMQAIRTKGGVNGTAVTDENEVYRRANTGLAMVMVNVECHAGTCTMSISSGSDYGNSWSVAYTALGNDPEHRRLTTVHEAGGHGFGKLGDEYGGKFITQFGTGSWIELNNFHSWGIHRNVDKYISADAASQLNSTDWPQTSLENVYWTELLDESYGYQEEESLGLYEGAYTYENFYCRSTDNSVMRSQFTGPGTSGEHFNAISRWAIWYRLMRLTNSVTTADFKSTLTGFVNWDATVSNRWVNMSARNINYVEDQKYAPLAPPVLVYGHWENGRFVVDNN